MNRRLFRSHSVLDTQKRAPGSGIVRLASRILLLASLFSVSCNQPFQPKVEYVPQLVLYSVLFSNDTTVYVRLSAMSDEADSSFNTAVHGAEVYLVRHHGYYDYADSTLRDITDTAVFAESSAFAGEDTVYYYKTFTRIVPGGLYTLTAKKEGYNSITGATLIPYSRVTVPTKAVYAILRLPSEATSNVVFDVALTSPTVAWFPEVAIEYRGFDANGRLHAGYVDVMGQGSQEPFRQVSNYDVSFSVPHEYYADRLKEAQQLTKDLALCHYYVDVIVTQINDPLYRFYITSGRWNDPLVMRTDKIVYSNLQGGLGVLGAAAVDTTRIYLY